MSTAYGRDGAEAVGGLAEEATRLLAVLQGLGWLRAPAAGSGARPRAGGPADPWAEAVEDPVDGGPAGADAGSGGEGLCTCAVCPLCRGLRMLREASPTAYLHLGEAVESFAAAVQELARAFAEAGSPRREGPWG